MSEIIRIAHRGASGYEAENSHASLLKAIELDVDYIEADVQLSRDGIPLIRHDKLLNRTTNTEGYTWEYDWNYYCDKIRIQNGETVASLESFCEIIASRRQKLYIDLKSFGREKTVIETCLRHLRNDQFAFGSFHFESVRNVKEIDPGISTVMIIEGNPLNIAAEVENSLCDVVAFGFDAIDQASIDKVHESGKKVFTWTVNHPREIERARSMGVDGITSDFPDRI